MNETKNRGFTLIELLAVISIIGLLSSVVLSVVRDASMQANNAQRNKVAESYINAVMLAYEEDGEYPNPGNTANYCLGNYAPFNDYNTPNVCGYGLDMSENSLVLVGPTGATGIARFLPSLPGSKQIPVVTIFGSSRSYQGPTYSCWILSGGKCTKAAVDWYLERLNQGCAAGALAGSAGSTDSTHCVSVLTSS